MDELHNPHISQVDMLYEMYDDEYFPNHLVDRIRDILWGVAKKIEESLPSTLDQLHAITHEAARSINQLKSEFDAAGSPLETVVRECICRSFLEVVDIYELSYDDPELLIGPREW